MKRRTIAWLVVPVLLITAGAVKSDANNVVEIMLHGHYFSEPATVRFIVAVQPDADNRKLRIEADSGEMFRASEVSLMGAGEKRLHTFTFKNLSAGHVHVARAGHVLKRCARHGNQRDGRDRYGPAVTRGPFPNFPNLSLFAIPYLLVPCTRATRAARAPVHGVRRLHFFELIKKP